MFITNTGHGYDRDGQAWSRGQFLVLMHPKVMKPCGTFEYETTDSSAPVRALVRHCSLHQLGHWMMGSIRVGKHKVTVSGAYGADGLIMSVPREVYDKGVELPKELYDAWATGEGWNSCGTEAPAMRKWALKTFYADRDPGNNGVGK